MAAGGKSMGKWAVRAAGSALALGAIFAFLPRDAILAGFARLSWPLFLTVLVLFLLCHVAAAAKWWLLMGRAIPLPVALRAHFAGLAANLCLPGAAGGDAVRAALAHLRLQDGPRVAAAAVGDRMIDLVALATLMLTGLLLLQGEGGQGLAFTVAGIVFALALGGLFLFPALAGWAWRRWPGLPARGLGLRVAEAFSALSRRPFLLLFALALSVAIQSVLILLSIRLAEQVGVHIAAPAWFLAWPLSKIIATLPVSLGGLGVREGTLAALLVPFGASAPDVVAAGLAWQGILYVAGAFGGLILLASGGGLGAVARPDITEIPK